MEESGVGVAVGNNCFLANLLANSYYTSSKYGATLALIWSHDNLMKHGRMHITTNKHIVNIGQ